MYRDMSILNRDIELTLSPVFLHSDHVFRGAISRSSTLVYFGNIFSFLFLHRKNCTLEVRGLYKIPLDRYS